ncbi:MAG: sodium-dependent transporter [Flavobacteriales bacterium]|nr:sodium-dependent transporter [Flavobacteriales bacterium]
MSNTENWGSRVGLVLAMAGNAVGLGNFLRFPVQAVQNGGGAFIIPYLVCFLLMGIPLLWVEWAMGRFGGRHGHHSTPFIMHQMDPRRALWKYIGVFGIFTNLAVAAYYCYLESWTLSYIWHSIAGTFIGQSADQVAGFFSTYVDVGVSTTGIPYEAVVFWILCLALNTWILAKGLSGGVEKVAKIGMPLLILFGVILAIRGVTLTAGENGAINDGTVGLNFLWTPDYSAMWSGKVWLAAAGQIFFTLSVGMGTIQCYASYVRKKDDIALNAMSAGWMNEFVEVVLGAAVIIPISIGYLGIDKVVELTKTGGLGLGFKTLPYLFTQWGPVLAAVAGVCWFGLLFFAGVTSSLAMGTPIMGFLKDEFGWKHKNAAWFFGGAVMLLGLPCVFWFSEGVFDEFDYWAGTVSLVVFALFEIILFAWIFGMDKGWNEINAGADIKVPVIFRYIIQYITPLFLIGVFIGSLPAIWEKMNEDVPWQVWVGRVILLSVFFITSWFVYVAYQKRRKQLDTVTP